MRKNEYREQLKRKMDTYAHFVYRVTRSFPKSELYGVVSQIRRAAVSVVLNYIEGYARRKRKVQLGFFEISYGSLKESKYLLYFSKTEGWLSEEDYNCGIEIAEEIGAMLWTEIQKLDKNVKK